MALMAELSPTPASLRSASMTHISPRSSSVLTTRLPLHRISQNTIPTGGHMDVCQAHGYQPSRYTPTPTIQQQIWTVRSTFFMPVHAKWRACLSCLVSLHAAKERHVQPRFPCSHPGYSYLCVSVACCQYGTLGDKSSDRRSDRLSGHFQNEETNLHPSPQITSQRCRRTIEIKLDNRRPPKKQCHAIGYNSNPGVRRQTSREYQEAQLGKIKTAITGNLILNLHGRLVDRSLPVWNSNNGGKYFLAPFPGKIWRRWRRAESCKAILARADSSGHLVLMPKSWNARGDQRMDESVFGRVSELNLLSVSRQSMQE